tara:strand:+ start:426 stop:980 length:555 start_codon:yes stop_codon:yes gene_type:complete
MKIIYLLLISLVFVSCQEEELTNNLETKLTKENSIFFIEDSHFEELLKLPNVLEAHNMETSNLEKKSISSLERKHDFVIDSSRIIKITTADFISYTTVIKRGNQGNKFFENFVVVKNLGKGETKAYIVKYTPTREIKLHYSHNSFYFEGSSGVKSISLDDDFFEDSDIFFKSSSDGCGGLHLYV